MLNRKVCHHVLEAKLTWISLQRIQVECLMVSVVAFIVTIELIVLRGKITDIARQEIDNILYVFFPDRKLLLPSSNMCNFAPQHNQSTMTMNATTKTVRHST